MAIARMGTVVLDCPDPKRLAGFYSAILGWEATFSEDDWVTVGDGRADRLAFQRVDDYQPPEWPGSDRPQQFHLDLSVDDIEEAEAAALALGAVKHAHQPGGGERFRVYLDPAGHPFCLCAS